MFLSSDVGEIVPTVRGSEPWIGGKSAYKLVRGSERSLVRDPGPTKSPMAGVGPPLQRRGDL